MGGPVISFLSDYGYRDEFVGVCHGVIARRCPGARVIDITHGVPRHDIRAGALTLRGALAYLPAGVHLAVVDPEVGAGGSEARRAVAVRTTADERVLVGPDNGLLALATERLGGAVEAVDIGRSAERLQPVSATFHGRDIFAPVAAAIADGSPLAAVGDPIPVEELRALELPRARLDQEGLHAHVLHIDSFGNLGLDATHAELAALGLRLGQELSVRVVRAAEHAHAAERPHAEEHPHAEGHPHAEEHPHTEEEHRAPEEQPARYARTFADVAPGELLLYEDAQRMAALAVNRASAAELLRAGGDAELLVRVR